MTIHGRPARFLLGLAAASTVLLSGCSSSGDATEGAGSAPAAETADLPGDDVLTQPPEDPSAVGLAETIATLPPGVLTGHLVLALTGTATFDEDVDGTCGADGAIALAMTLDDGSAVLLEADGTGARLQVTAPGLVLDNDLSDVRTERDGESIVIAAALFQAGTSESAGSLELEASCG